LTYPRKVGNCYENFEPLFLLFGFLRYLNGLAAMLAKEVFSHAVVPKIEPNFGVITTNRSHILYWWIGFLPSKYEIIFQRYRGEFQWFSNQNSRKLRRYSQSSACLRV
jgi:hypothetical protein